MRFIKFIIPVLIFCLLFDGAGKGIVYSAESQNEVLPEEPAIGVFRIELEKDTFTVGENIKITFINDFPKKIYMYPLSVEKFIDGKWVEWRFDLYSPCTSFINRAGDIIAPGGKETVVYDQIGHDFQSDNTGCTSSEPGKYKVTAWTNYGERWQDAKKVIYFREFEIKSDRWTTIPIEKDFDGKVWKGSCNLSSGHGGEIEINLSGENSFYLILPDEEMGYQYTGKVKEFFFKDGKVTIRSYISEVKKSGINIETGVLFSETYPLSLLFEVILEGVWLKATPGPQEIIEGEIRFDGTAEEAQWLLDKTGRFSVAP